MVAFLPSEVARLVLGYLKDQNCLAAYHEFLEGSKHLEECRGREFYTTIMGLSLQDILDDYCAIHSYILQFKCNGDLKKRLSKCLNLSEKISTLIQDSFSNSVYSTEIQTSNLCSRTSPNSDSTDELSSFKNKRCGKILIPPTERSLSKKNNSFQNINECIIKSTNLFDLPGHKNDFNPKSNAWKSKEHENDSQHAEETPLENSSDKKNNKTYFSKDIAHHSIEKIGSSFKSKTPETRETDFRYALGLVKNDTPELEKFTPVKRKTMKPKMSSLSIKKSNHMQENFTNESLDVTTITNALLDCKELHEQIAKNINQMIHPSSKLDVDGCSSRADDVATSFKEISKTNDPLVIDEDTQQFDGVIKAIVEKTEKDPIFDQFLNEILGAPVESNTGSDSDVLSRPETSTPEKSCPSGYACSPTSSCHSVDFVEPQDKNLNKIAHPWKSLYHNHDKKSDTLEAGKNSIKTDFFHPKKYPRRPRGGKRMDILRQNYADYDFEHCNDSTQSLPSENNIKDPGQLNKQSSKNDQKVVILSNETVKSNITEIINEGIISEDKSASIISEISTSTHTAAQIQLRKKVCQMKRVMVSSKITNSQVNPIDNCTSIKEKKNEGPNESDNNEIIDLECITVQNKAPNEILAASTDKIKMANTIPFISGKPTDLIISNGNILLQNPPVISGTKPYTEAEIMKMPTIILIKPIEQSSGIKEENYKCKNDNNFATEKSNVKFIPVLPNINNSNDILSLIEAEKYQPNNYSMDIIENQPLIQPLPCENEIVLCKPNDAVVSSSDFKTDDKILASSFKDETNPEFKTTTPDIDTFKKLCSSTPTRKYTHVRILDFNTPNKTTHKRKALTSPKKLMSVDRRQKNSKAKSCLFAPVNEENDALTDSINKVSSPRSENVPKEKQIEASYTNDNDQNIIEKVMEDKKDSEKDKIANAKKAKVRKFNWDCDLRAMAVPNPLPNTDDQKKKKTKRTKHRKILNKKEHEKIIDLTNSFETEGKLLEQALLEKSFGSGSPLVKNSNLNSSDLMKNDNKPSSFEQTNDELQLSIVSTPDDTFNQTRENLAPNEKFKKLKRKTNEYCLPKPRVNVKISQKGKVSPRKKNNKNQSSTIKIKLGPKVHSDSVKKHSSEEINKSEKKKNSLKKIEPKGAIVNQTNDSSSNNFKEAEIHVTPEFPREYRSQPIDVKLNLSSFLETPFKTNLLDISIATPKFLSPDLLSEPISAIKMLGIPTPNFDTPFLQSNVLFSGQNCTPDSLVSRKTDYSSSGSYYKPDEVDLPLLDPIQKQPPINSEIDPLNKDSSFKKEKNKKSKSTKQAKSKTSQKPKIDQKKIQIKQPQIPNLVKQNDSDLLNNSVITNENNRSSMVLRTRLSKNFGTYASLFKRNTISPKEDKCKSKIVNPIKKSVIDKSITISKSQTDQNPDINNREKENQMCESKLDEVKNNEKESLEEKRLRTISKLNSEKKPPVRKTKKIGLLSKTNINKDIHKCIPNKKSILKSDSPKPTTKSQSSLTQTACNKFFNENEIKKINHIPLSKSRRKSSTPRKLEKTYESTPSPLLFKDYSKKNLSIDVSEENVKSVDNNVKNEVSSENVLLIPLVFNQETTSNNSKVDTIDKTKSDFQLNLEKEGFSAEAAREIENKIKNDNVSQEFCVNKNLDEDKIVIYENESCNSPAQISYISNIDPVTDAIIFSHCVVENSKVSTECTEKNLKECDILLEENQKLETIGSLTNNKEEEEDNVVIWGNSESNKETTNYLFIQHDYENKNKKKSDNQSFSQVELSSFTINANVYNTVKDIEESRVIKANEFKLLIDMSPNSKLRPKLSTGHLKSADSKRKKSHVPKKQPSTLELLMVEMNQSSSSNTNIKVEKLGVDRTENVSKTTVTVTGDSHKTSPLCALSVGVEVKQVILEKGDVNKVKTSAEINFDDDIAIINESEDLMDIALTNSTVEKRKRNDQAVSEGANKKHKSVIPQKLLKEIDIEEILSQLHPS